MSRILCTLILFAGTSACSGDAPGRSGADAAPVNAAKDDPVLLKVCQAFDDVAAKREADADNVLLARAAVRATELGVSEAQLATLGPQPPQLLANIRKRGAPPACAAFVAYLERLP